MGAGVVQEAYARGTDASPRARFAYQPALDGLRAAAVLAVFLYHADPRHAPGGFLGVDVFFVISGYLITSLLLREVGATGRIDFRAFWSRRARRLLPALACVLAFVALYAWLWAGPSERSVIRGDGIASELYFANWHFILAKLSYFTQGTQSPLRHMWSLAIEEQWYLVWPLVFAAVAKFAHRNLHRALIIGGSLAAIASAAQMIHVYNPHGDPSRAYYGTDTRVQALLVGVVLAALLDRVPERTRGARHWTDPFGAAAAIALVAMVVLVGDHSDWLYRGGFGLAAILAAVLIATAIRPGIVQMLLSVPTVRYIGRISYGIYLWSLPVIVWLNPQQTHTSGASLLALQLSVTLIFASLSYALIELPIRHNGWGALKERIPRVTRALLPAGLAVALAGALFVTTTESSTWTLLTQHDAQHRDVLASLQPEVPVANTVPAPVQPPRKPRGMVIGDSSALTLLVHTAYVKGFSDATKWSDHTRMGCALLSSSPTTGPPLDACRDLYSDWAKAIPAENPDLVVLETGPWEVQDHWVNGHRLRGLTTEYRDYLVGQYESALELFTSRGAHVVLLDALCLGPSQDHSEGARERLDPARWAMVNSVIHDVAALHPRNVTVLQWSALVCPGGTYHDTLQGVKIRDDGVHFTEQAAPMIWKWIEPQLDAAAARARDERDRPRAKTAPQ